ncbi:MAG: lytic transglycosylase domain-containing protein [Fluviicola sp.]|nr:lytic transglycosylase domain-containing protein [Fluviicola sp.]
MTIQSPLTIFASALLIIQFSSCNSQNERPTPERTYVIGEAEKHFTMPPTPDSISFCGVTVRMDNFDLRERLDRELIVNTYRHSATIQYIKRAKRFFPAIEKALAKNGIPEDMKYLCVAESGLAQVTSRSGAKGFWQFMPATAKEYGMKINSEIDERMNVEKSTTAACKYLNTAYKKFDDWFLAAAGYNRGMGGIQKDLDAQGVSSYFDLQMPEETNRYVFRIIALKIVMENPEAYGFYPEEFELYEPVETRTITVNSSIPNLATWAKENGSTYRMLRLLNTWIVGNKLTFRGSEYKIQLPK